MLFNSFEFLIFFIAVIPVFFALPHKLRWAVLLIASVVFYGFWKVEYLSLILLSAVTDYFCGLKMSGLEEKKKRKPYLLLSLFVNLGILFVFKYYNFFSQSIGSIFGTEILGESSLILPMGISFYTFQTLAYTIDVYNGKIKREKHFGIFSLYVTFFPQLVAGPIERASNLLPQFRKKAKFSPVLFASGMRLIAWGLFKKTVIADRLAQFVDPIYGAPTEYGGLVLALATLFFAFQIYCDFSGYSDIAIGTARILGVELMKNFRTPYYSSSISEFWKRWHISLSTWFRDYLYIPLGGSRTSKFRWNMNLMIVFLVSGLWHGANWTFVAWGGLHGSYLILENQIRSITGPISKKWKLANWFSIGFCFILVLVSWVFFRAADIGQAFDILAGIGTASLTEVKDFFWLLKSSFSLDLTNFNEPASIGGVRLPIQIGPLLLSLVVIGFIHVMEQLYETDFARIKLHVAKPIVSGLVLAVLSVSIVLLGVFESNEFIYFQF